MKQLVQRIKDGEMKVVDLPIPFLKPKGVLVQNYFSLISAGTERTTVESGKENLLVKAYKNPDVVKQVYQIVRRDGLIPTIERILGNLNDYKTLGYSSAGVVLESSSEKFKPGDRVACAGAGYANHAEVVFVPENLCVKLPENVSFEEGAFTTLGAIALQGIRLANPTLGENVAVIGLGLLGLITVQLLKANGCKVIGLDISDQALLFAKQIGADYVLKSSKSEKETILNLTNGIGVDKVLITAGTESNEPIELSGLITREKGKVVVVGAVKMDIPRGPFYNKEIEVVISKSYGPGRYDPKYEEMGIDYPVGYVRWTENRNMQAIVELLFEGKLNFKSLITHKFSIDDYQKAYDLVLGKTQEFYRGILFEYPTTEITKTKQVQFLTKTKSVSKTNVGFIGAGSFAQSSLLPHLKNLKVNLVNVCTTDGLTASNVARKFGFQKFTTSPEEILNDPKINVVFIGDGNNVCNSIMVLSAKLGWNFIACGPKGYQPDSKILYICKEISKLTGSKIEIFNNPQKAVQNADVIYTDVWTSMGQEKERALRRKIFAPYQVNSKLLLKAPKEVIVSHCLPAHRGEEITDDVLDSSKSVALDEAENRLHVQKAAIINLFS